MKKYIKPEIEVCVLNVENCLLAASDPREGDNIFNTTPVDGPSALSKDHSFDLWAYY